MVTGTSAGSAPAWFRVAGVVAILWNAMGIFQFAAAMGAFGDPLATLDSAERAAAASIPSWIFLPFGIGTISGLAGSLALLLRGRWALPLLLLSLISLAVLEGWIVFLSGILEEFGGIALPATITVVALVLAWLAYHGRQRGWLR